MFNDKKHPRDAGKFSKIQGGLSGQGDDPNKSQQMPVQGGDEDLRIKQARDMIAKQFGQRTPGQVNPADVRDTNVLRGLGFHAGVGYKRSAAAIDALHSSGDLQAMHHHGKILQDAVKALKTNGAKGEEIDKLRRGLTGLHSALVRNDRVGAHEALGQLQHGFYHSHAAFQKEYGPGTFPLIGDKLKQAEAGAAEKTAARPAPGFGKGKPAGGVPINQGHSPDYDTSPTPKEEPKKKPEVMRDESFEMFKNYVAACTETLKAERAAPAAGQPITLNMHMPGQAPVTFNGAPVTVNSAPPVMVEDRESAEKFKSAVTAAVAAKPDVVVHTAPVKVDVHNQIEPTPVKFEATVMPAPAAPVTIQVQPTPVAIHNHNNIEAKPGEVKVVLPERKARDLKFETDKEGKIVGASVK